MDRILIVEDMAETAVWLADIARRAFPDCRIDVASTTAAGLAAAEAAAYDLALIDLRLPDGSGLDVLRAVKAGRPETIGVVITALGEDEDIIAALAAGANGYVLKHETPDAMRRHLRDLADGVPALSPSIALRIMDHFRHTGPAPHPEEPLTAREIEVLGLIGSGLRNADVANALGVRDSTVASHIKAIYRKLGISSRAEAARHASRLSPPFRPNHTPTR